MRQPLSSYHPILYWLRVTQKRLSRRLHWAFSAKYYSKAKSSERLEHRYNKHTSKLIRKLGESDLRLQYNKVTNLRIASEAMNGITIYPGEYFSFCRLVGKPTARRGFLEGMELSFGEARSGIGGGICQLSNLIHWMILHSPLQFIERANHSFDPFPDEGRVLPFGSGAAIFYNYIDLVFYNPTSSAFQLVFNVAEHQLEGELLCSSPREVKYHIYEKNHKFTREKNIIYRHNEIWQKVTTKGQELATLQDNCLYRNKVVVKYSLDESKITSE